MNARGKQLTDFENFKADLIDFAPDLDKPQDKLLDISTASLIDNEWTDVFWKEASRAGIYKVDDLFFTFLRRYFLNKFIATSTLKSNELQEDKFYKYVYKGEGKEEGYTGFDIYRHVLNDSVIEDLKLFFRRWKASGIDNNDLQPLWSIPTEFCLIPQYGKEDAAKVSTVSRKGRVVSYAVCCYFEENESYNKEYFKDWLRFVWNVAENGNLYDEGDMINAIRIVHELRTRSGDILSFLASDEKYTQHTQEYRLPKSVSKPNCFSERKARSGNRQSLKQKAITFSREISPASSVMAARSMLMTLSALRKSIVMPVIISMPTV